MSEPGGSIKNPDHEAEHPAPMPDGSKRSMTADQVKGPEKATDRAGQQGDTHGGGQG